MAAKTKHREKKYIYIYIVLSALEKSEDMERQKYFATTDREDWQQEE